MLFYGSISALIIVLFSYVAIAWRIKRKANEEDEFINRLSMKVSSQIDKRSKLNLYDVPFRFRGLYNSIDGLLRVLPPPTGLDKLTGVMNRLGLKRRLAMLMPIQTGVFILIDIHRFRYVNDLFGFTLGDQLLKRMSERLKCLPQKPKLLARMSGAEFFMYLDSGTTYDELQSLQHHLQSPFDIKGTPISVRLKIGVLDVNEHFSDVSVMLKRLDLAIKKASDHPELIAGYREGDDSVQLRELEIIGAIPKALERNEPYIVFQPKEELIDGGFRQVEALIRWEHKKFGPLSPSEFIPLAERAGIIDLISRWTLEQIFIQQRDWRAAGLYTRVAVNLSSEDLCSDTLVDDIKSGFERYKLPPDCLMIEITESSLMEDTAKAIQILTLLRNLGVKIAMDDFGTGHSSLAYLKNLPIDEVKIDRSFLAGIFNEKASLFILEASISLPKKLGLDVTVEGVETAKVRELMIRLEVDKIQGQFYAKPMRPFELELKWNELNRQTGINNPVALEYGLNG
ncbi:GGDEF-domain containing protein [Shewanella sp. OPT22]|nr:GGDEF-domain containing protein [Shewanella sp. OPT22]